MRDLLLEISENQRAKRVVKTLGLPIPLPQKLRRSSGPWEERPLDEATVVTGGDGELGALIARTVIEAGAYPHVVGDDGAAEPFREPAEAWGRPVKVIAPGETPEANRARALLFDASGLEEPAGLRVLYDFFHSWIGRLERCGRVVVLGRPPQASQSPAAAAASAALEGFTRSVAKEVGRYGSTAQLVYVEPGAEQRAGPALRWLLSPRSAFVTGQPLFITGQVRSAGRAPQTRPLHGKVALVTGAARGIGAATAERLAREGAHVVCLDRPADDGPTSQVARSIGGSTLLVDISEDDAPQRIADELTQRHGGVDIVVHNAGVTRDKTLARMKEELWDQAIAINLHAVTRVTEALADGVLRDEGRVVCLSSVAGIAGNVGQTNYAASKAGVIGFVRSLAPRLAPRGTTVNAIAPGFIETRLTAAMPVTIREVARRLSALGQGGEPGDVGEAVTFLASPGADGITGGVLRVCGGAFVGA